MSEHQPTYFPRLLGYHPITHKKFTGYTVKCSCGWSEKTNENRSYAAMLFREHKAESVLKEKENGEK